MIKNRKKGFTFLEVIVSLALIGLVVVMFSVVYVACSKMLNGSRILNQDSLKAQKNLEEKKGTAAGNRNITFSFEGETLGANAVVYIRKDGKIEYRLFLSEAMP